MANLSLRCKDKRFPKGDWLLTLDEERGTLTDSEGTTRATFPRAEAAGRFVLPSFWESVKDLRVRADGGDIIWFDPDKAIIARIKAYLHGALAAQGSEVVRAVRRKGWLLVFAGVGITAAAIFVMVASMVRAFGNPEGGTYYVTIGATVFGLIVLSRGLAALTNARRAASKLDEQGNRAAGTA